MKRAFLFLLLIGAVGAFLVLPFWVMDKAPLADVIYFNQKIFYYHVPAAFVMFVSVFVSGIAAIGFLSTRKQGWDDVAAAGGDLVVVFGAIVLTTGPIWAKPAWGVWWTWDARLTSSLLLWITFVAYALVRRFGGPGSERLSAGLALFGMVNVPMIYFAVNFWKTQHPTNNVVPSLQGDMKVAFLIGVIGYFSLFGLLLAARLGLRRGERLLDRAHELAVEAGRLE